MLKQFQFNNLQDESLVQNLRESLSYKLVFWFYTLILAKSKTLSDCLNNNTLHVHESGGGGCLIVYILYRYCFLIYSENHKIVEQEEKCKSPVMILIYYNFNLFEIQRLCSLHRTITFNKLMFKSNTQNMFKCRLSISQLSGSHCSITLQLTKTIMCSHKK